MRSRYLAAREGETAPTAKDAHRIRAEAERKLREELDGLPRRPKQQ